ncbi:hypothetical protein ARMGADRAFT_424857 [Armillaria gallica]|uniref:Uncharacterized protein n=1 Tax=Armillaria gallica TaxID=47427 RepID=A0A2H3E1R1_ARMGA|nr:hypothetical protein ARMGADRAFT_424857 [Armillaria gallica]
MDFLEANTRLRFFHCEIEAWNRSRSRRKQPQHSTSIFWLRGDDVSLSCKQGAYDNEYKEQRVREVSNVGQGRRGILFRPLLSCSTSFDPLPNRLWPSIWDDELRSALLEGIDFR